MATLILRAKEHDEKVIVHFVKGGELCVTIDSEVMRKPLRIFVLADTHNRMPPNLAKLADGTDEIWHLGDVCAESILDQLRAIGPRLTLVRGNCDSNSEWPLVVDLLRNGLRFRLQHIPPPRPPEDCDVLLHAHTHVPRNEIVGGIRFLNPGCVTRPNRGAPPSIAFMKISADGQLNWRLQQLT